MTSTLTTSNSSNRLSLEADKFLRQRGYRADGRKSKSVDWRQSKFERSMFRHPFCGRSTRHKK